ncbi:amidoligase family protein [Haliea sp. E17]|uniref:amidoligase family protein n=1 Tax=Haliea sp. E17 TaxID=3401576 RepID=UPI003AAC0FAE
MPQTYLLPPRNNDASGADRAAGFEFEFGNLPITATAEALQEALGGTLEKLSPFEAILHDSDIGRLKIERDADLLKSRRYRGWLEQLGVEFSPGSIAHEIESNIDNASRGLIPCEVVTQPIPFRQLSLLDDLVSTLAGMGAEGTGESLTYAFGLHINPSLADQGSDSILRSLQSFLLLHDWFVDAGEIDRTRRYLTPYIDRFPQDYMELVLRPGYRPDLPALIDDYLEHNPTRNRALDMLPIFHFLDAPRVEAALPKDERRLVKGRPAFHYRLPDCRINEPGWHVSSAWNSWVYIERIAEDEDLLSALIAAWQDHYQEFRLAQASRWVRRLTSLLAERYLAS